MQSNGLTAPVAVSHDDDATEIKIISDRLLRTHATKDAYVGWDHSGHCIIKARDASDLELLRLYEKLITPSFPNGMIGSFTHMVGFMRRNGYKDISNTFTEAHVESLSLLEDELMRRTISIMVAQFLDPRHDPLRVVLMENMHRKEMFFSLVRDRNIVDGERMREALAQMGNHHPSLATGTL